MLQGVGSGGASSGAARAAARLQRRGQGLRPGGAGRGGRTRADAGPRFGGILPVTQTGPNSNHAVLVNRSWGFEVRIPHIGFNKTTKAARGPLERESSGEATRGVVWTVT